MSEANDILVNLDIKRFYKIYENVHQMLADREYNPVDPKMTYEEYISFYLGLLAVLEDPDNDIDAFAFIDELALLFERRKKNLLVYFYPLDSKLCQSDMSYIHRLVRVRKAKHLIIVVNNNATPKASSVVEILGHTAQLFKEKELLINVTKHQLVPKHTLVTGEERDRILNHYAIGKDGQIHLDLFPGIFSTDPICKYYNFKLDDLIEIQRPRPDGYKDLTYRIVIHPITDKDKKN